MKFMYGVYSVYRWIFDGKSIYRLLLATRIKSIDTKKFKEF